MTPPPFSRIHLNTGWVQQKVPFRCTLRTLSQLVSLALAKVSSSRMPALFTRISARPKFLMASLKTASPPASVEMSEPLATARPPSALIASTTFCAIDLSAPDPSRAHPLRRHRLSGPGPPPRPAKAVAADPRALAGEQLRVGLAEAAARPRDDGHFLVEQSHVSLLYLFLLPLPPPAGEVESEAFG